MILQVKSTPDKEDTVVIYDTWQDVLGTATDLELLLVPSTRYFSGSRLTVDAVRASLEVTLNVNTRVMQRTLVEERARLLELLDDTFVELGLDSPKSGE